MNKIVPALALSAIAAGCSTSYNSPEEQAGYFVDIHQSQARGGVGSHVDRNPPAREDYFDKGEYTAVRGKPAYSASSSGSGDQASNESVRSEETTVGAMDEVTTSQSAPAPQVPETPPQSDPSQLVSELRDDLLFESNSASLKPTATQQLQSLGDVLSQNQDMTVTISGHADAVGSDSYNQELSKLRAESVRETLISRGVRPDQIRIQGHGEEKPIASNDTDDGRAQNRRVDINIG